MKKLLSAVAVCHGVSVWAGPSDDLPVDPDPATELRRNIAYWQSDADRDMLERSLDLSSKELLQNNKKWVVL